MSCSLLFSYEEASERIDTYANVVETGSYEAAGRDGSESVLDYKRLFQKERRKEAPNRRDQEAELRVLGGASSIAFNCNMFMSASGPRERCCWRRWGLL